MYGNGTPGWNRSCFSTGGLYNPALEIEKKFNYNASFLYHCGHKIGNFQTVFLILYKLYMYSADWMSLCRLSLYTAIPLPSRKSGKGRLCCAIINHVPVSCHSLFKFHILNYRIVKRRWQPGVTGLNTTPMFVTSVHLRYFIWSFTPFASLLGTICWIIWRQYKLKRATAVRLWPCKCLEVIGPLAL